MDLGDDWDDVKIFLTESGDAVRGELDNYELTKYINSLDTITRYTAIIGGIGGILIGEETGIYSKEATNEAAGLDGWEDPSDFSSIKPLATGGFSGALTGVIAIYGRNKLVNYVREQHDRDQYE